MGSYVSQRVDNDGAKVSIAGHTAASGTGGDTAHFREFVTSVEDADGVAFQSGSGETVVECQRGDLTPFVIKVDQVELSPELQGCDITTVVLNGFDLYALQHSEKMVTFDLDITEPVLSDGGTKVRFYIIGHLRFDCRSPECQLLPIRLESVRVDNSDEQEDLEPYHVNTKLMPAERVKRGIDRHKIDKAVLWLRKQLVKIMGVDEVKEYLIGRDADSTRRRLFRIFGRRLYLRFIKWELAAPYVIRVHYVLVGGQKDALAVNDTAYFEHTYAWDLENEIHQEDTGVIPVMVPASDCDIFQINTLAFRQMSMDITIDETLGTEDPVQWGKGMHLLEWCMAVRDIESGRGGVRAKLDLFFKCWSEAMNAVITLTTWGAVRGAGSVRIGARLALLQIKKANGGQQRVMPGHIIWPGIGRSAVTDPRARCERTIPLERSDTQGVDLI